MVRSRTIRDYSFSFGDTSFPGDASFNLHLEFKTFFLLG